MKKIFDNKKIILVMGGILILIFSLVLYLFNDSKEIEDNIVLNITTELITEENNDQERFFVDVKGSVKNPGVYEIKENYTIQNIINDAGGLTKDSYTNNINLSKKVTDEMVIFIHNKNEIKKIQEFNNCVCEPIYKYIECEEKVKDKLKEELTTTTTQTTKPLIEETTIIATNVITTTTQITTTKQGKININLCNKEDLLILDGLGEKKALAIIEYRENNGKFETRQDIMKVSGIGQSTFEKIKLLKS